MSNNPQQSTMNDQSPEENLAENATTNLYTFKACSADSFGILTAEDGWINFTSDDSTVDKDEMQQRLESLQSKIGDFKGEAIAIKIVNEGSVDDPELSFIDFDTHIADEALEDFEPADVDDDYDKSSSSSSSSSDSGYDDSSPRPDYPRVKAKITLWKDGKERVYTGHSQPDDRGDGVPTVETRAVKRAIVFSPALHNTDVEIDDDAESADKAACLKAINAWADDYMVETTVIDGGGGE